MLRNGSGSLAQIAAEVGYDSEAAFSRAFKRAFGQSPASWRKTVGQSDVNIQ
jgi:AraC-like DNA-binding protein